MATQPASTTKDWREIEKRADTMVPADIAERIPVQVTDGGRAVRIGKSRVTLPVLIGDYRNGRSVECLANEVFPHLEQTDVQAVIDYYNSDEGSWIDPYIEVLLPAADLRHQDFQRRWEAGEFGSRRFGSKSHNGSNE
ncbi:MAG: DUF433 domain-containing protein [Chloroflexi bacterium]|nr:DUF433 domain-containing protein [Chloroflexota bacterium]